MSIRARIQRLIRVKRSSGQTAGVQTVEDAHRQQLQAYEDARRSTADLAATHRKLDLLCRETSTELGDLERQAEQAVASGDDGGARRALRRSLSTRQRLDELTAQRQDAGRQLGQLEDELDRIASRVADQQLQYHELKARHGVSEATSSMRQAGAASDQAAADAATAAWEKEREDRRARHLAEAQQEVAGANASRFDAEFQELEANSSIESQLARLKEAEDSTDSPGDR